MMIGTTKNIPLVSLSFVIPQNLNFIAFGAQTLLENEVHHASFELFQLKNIPIQTHFFCSGMFWNDKITNVL